MSESLRDQLLKAGLISKKQANDAERQQQRQERQPPRHGRAAAPERPRAPAHADGAKAARDQALNREQRDKAEKKARLAQIKQLIEQNRLPTPEGEEYYNFVDGDKIRRIAVNASARARLMRGDIAIARHEGRYDLVPAAIAARIRERDASAIVAGDVGKQVPQSDDAYAGFPVPDDLMW